MSGAEKLREIQMESKVRQLLEYKQAIAELEAMAAAIADDLKAAMTVAGTDKMTVGTYKLSYVDVCRRTLDQKRLEADLGDLSEYMNTTTYKRFNVA